MGERLGEEDITPLLNQANEKVMELLKEHKSDLEALADELVAQQKLTDEQLRRHLKMPPCRRTKKPHEAQAVFEPRKIRLWEEYGKSLAKRVIGKLVFDPVGHMFRGCTSRRSG